MDEVKLIRFGMLMSEKLFSGYCSASAVFEASEKGTLIECGQQFWLGRFSSDGDATVGGIINRIDAFTDRISSKIRMGLLGESSTVLGQVFEPSVCTKVNYNWLLFPTILVAVTSRLLLWSLVRNWQNQDHELLWKSSTLPLLFYGDRFV
ncbi:hypothetical protein GGR58DRAFT_490696, partial [Xylaria digitata]